MRKRLIFDDRESIVMAKQRRTLFRYERPQFIGEEFSIQAPGIVASNFKIKARTIRLTQNFYQSMV